MSLIAGNLGAVQRLLDDAGLSWGVCAGAAAYIYGSRRPIKNVDILLRSGCLRQVRDLLQASRRTAQYNGRILLWRGIKLFDDLTVAVGQRRCPFMMDQLMEEHLRRLPLLGSRVLVLAPEDILVHKALLNLQGDASGADHHQDLQAVIRMQEDRLDIAYLQQRLRRCQLEEQVQTILEEAGLAFPA